MKKHILLVMALFGVLTIGSCNDDEPVVSPIPGEDEEVVIPAPEPINPVLVQTLYFDFGSVGGGTRGSQTESPDENGHYWNNIYNNDGIYAAVNSVFEDFVNSEGTSVGYKLTLNTRYSTNGGSAGGYKGAKGSPWEGGHRVPGICYMPGTIKEGTTCEQTVMSFDLFPTMLDMADIHYNDSKKKLDGTSLVPLFKGENLATRLLFWGNGNKTISVRDGKWKLVRYNQKGDITLHLFDLNNDPYEKNNLSKQEPELVERLDKEITRWAESVYSEVPDQFARKVQRTNKK